LLGTPIAKLTHPKYAERQDYKDKVFMGFFIANFVDELKQLSNIYER